MCDFEDDFGENGFTDDDSFEDSIEGEIDEPFSGDTEKNDEPNGAESQDDDFTVKDAFIIGGAFGFGYEQGLRGRKRRQRKRLSDDLD